MDSEIVSSPEVGVDLFDVVSTQICNPGRSCVTKTVSIIN